MAVRNITSLLLALVFLCVVAVPSALADGTPPGSGGNIHPWDNSDDFQFDDRGWVTSISRPIIIVVTGPSGPMLVVYFGQSKQVVEASTTSGYTTDKTVKTKVVAAGVDKR